MRNAKKYERGESPTKFHGGRGGGQGKGNYNDGGNNKVGSENYNNGRGEANIRG